jgi:hypothetical protein
MRLTLLLLRQAEVLGPALQHLRQMFLDGVADLGLVNGTDCPSQIDAPIPCLNRRQTGQPDYVFAIGSSSKTRKITGSLLWIVRDATCHDETGRQPLKVPLKGSWQRFIEIVDVEDRCSLGRRVGTEIGQVRVTTSLHSNIWRWGRGQICSHYGGGTP